MNEDDLPPELRQPNGRVEIPQLQVEPPEQAEPPSPEVLQDVPKAEPPPPYLRRS